MQSLIDPPPSRGSGCLLAPPESGARGELYQMAFAAYPAGFIVWDGASHIIDWNPAAERIFGWTRAEAMAQPRPHFLVSPDVWPHVEGVFVRLLEAEEPTDSLNDNVTRDGRVIHCEWHNIPMRDRQGRVSGFVSIVQDVTPRKLAEAALQAEVAERKRAEIELERVLTQSEQIIASITSILITVDENDLVTTWNAAAAAAFGLRTAEALGRRFTDCGIGWDWAVILGGAAQCTAQQKPVRLDDIPYVTHDGRERFLGVTLNPINHYSDEPMGFLLLGADITNRRVLEGQLAHAQKMESIGHLAAGIAHEINTPIQYVGDNTRFLQETWGDLHPLLEACRAPAPDPAGVASAAAGADLEYLLAEIPQALGQSLEGIARVSHIVRAMKDFSHPGTASKVMTDLNRALDSTVTVASNEWKYVADLLPDFDPDLPLVPCLPADLNQVFLNIIVNAAHAIGDVVGGGLNGKGIITVSTRRVEDWVEIRFSDTGAGMTEEVKARIFDPFFTTKPVGRGTGQGLAISHAVVVKKHKGTIRVETAPGRGTTFVIRLPLKDSSEEGNNEH
jgi:PAS domain S-box-containing protein